MDRKSKSFLMVALTVWFSHFQSPVCHAEPSKHPNVLFVLCDDLRWNALGCTGHPHIKTPHIDSLAKQSVLFENSFCTTSLCSPSRASILSGLYAHTHGVTNNFTEYPADMASFPRQLQAVIVFMGDNGLLEGEHGMVDKRTMHEASIRIPLVIRYPKLNGGKPKQIAEQVLTVDLAPTICELAGVEPLPKVHGRSMVQLINHGDDQWRTAWLYHYNYEKQFPYTPNIRGVRTDRWKLIRYPHGDGSPQRHMSELYDLKNDPHELRNLINEPDQKQNIEQLSKQLAELMAATGITVDKIPLDEGINEKLPDKAIR